MTTCKVEDELWRGWEWVVAQGESSWETSCENSPQKQPGGTRNPPWSPVAVQPKLLVLGWLRGLKSRLKRLHLGLKLKARQAKLGLSL